MKQLAFYVPIYKYKVKDWKNKKTKLLDLFNSLHHQIVENVITSTIDVTTHFLDEEIKLFEDEYGDEFITTIVWFQKYEKCMNHSVHTHGAFGFSAICFIEYDKTCHKPTTFISPFGNCVNDELERYEPDVEEGDIIFFPSNLLHYAPTNRSDKDRIVMSFNLSFKEGGKKYYNE